MQLTLEFVTKGFVSSFEEEEFELTKYFYSEPDFEAEDEDEIKENTERESSSEDEREIFDDDSAVIRELF